MTRVHRRELEREWPSNPLEYLIKKCFEHIIRTQLESQETIVCYKNCFVGECYPQILEFCLIKAFRITAK
jgi:hypothetical protein